MGPPGDATASTRIARHIRHRSYSNRMRYALAVIALICCSTVAEAKQPYEGSFAGSTEACDKPDDGNIRISGSNYFEHEGSCKIRKTTKIDRGFKLDLECSGEGEKWRKQVSLYPHGSVMEVGENNQGRRVYQCEEEKRPANWPR